MTQLGKGDVVGAQGDGRVVPWTVDTSRLTDPRAIGGLLVVAPPGLSEFLDPEKQSPIQVLYGPKGTGKSHLLLKKRIELDKMQDPDRIVCLPAKSPFVFRTGEGDAIKFVEEAIHIYSDRNAWIFLWCVLVGAYIFQHLDTTRRKLLSEKDGNAHVYLHSDLRRFLMGEARETADLPDSITDALLLIINQNQSKSRLEEAYKELVLPGIAQLPGNMMFNFFLDSFDETFRDQTGQTLVDFVNARNEVGVRSFDVWANAQNSLVSVAQRLRVDSGHRVFVYAAIRGEAYAHYQGDLHGKSKSQLESEVFGLQYSRDALLEIFELNVNCCDPKRLPEPKATDAIVKFFGAKEKEHPRVKQSENMFRYVLRHTFERPRDLMVMGGLLYRQLSVEELKQPNECVRIVHEASQTVFDEYVNFMGLQWDRTVGELCLRELPRNVLDADDLEKIRQRLKGPPLEDIDPIDYLYTRGLLGYPRSMDGALRQYFAIADSREDKVRIKSLDTNKVPTTTHYLVHPAASEVVKTLRRREGYPEYIVDGRVIVGHRRHWPERLPEIRVKVGLTPHGQPIILVDGVDLSGDGEKAFKDFSFGPTVLVFAMLTAMARHKSGDLDIKQIVDVVKEMREGGICHAYLSRARAEGYIENYMAQHLTGGEGGETRPAMLTRIDEAFAQHKVRLKTGTSQRYTRYSIQGQSATLPGLTGNEIELQFSSLSR